MNRLNVAQKIVMIVGALAVAALVAFTLPQGERGGYSPLGTLLAKSELGERLAAPVVTAPVPPDYGPLLLRLGAVLLVSGVLVVALKSADRTGV